MKVMMIIPMKNTRRTSCLFGKCRSYLVACTWSLGLKVFYERSRNLVLYEKYICTFRCRIIVNDVSKLFIFSLAERREK